MENLDKSRLFEMLRRIDREASLVLPNGCERCSVIIVGGSALLLSDLTSRKVTYDVDVLSFDGRLRDILADYRAVNGAVAAYADQIPYNFEDRLVRIPIETEVVDFYTPSAEDLAVMKLYGLRPVDEADLNSPEFLCSINWDLMDDLVLGPDEAKASAVVERRYEAMVRAYRAWAEGHGHEADA